MTTYSEVIRASQGNITSLRKKVSTHLSAFVPSTGNGTWDATNSNSDFTLSNGNLTANDQGWWSTVCVICNYGLIANANQDASWYVNIDQYDGGSLDVGMQVSVANGGVVNTRPGYYPQSGSGALAIQVGPAGKVIDSVGDQLAIFGSNTAIGDYFQFRLQNGYLYIRKQNPQTTGTWTAWNGSTGTYSNATPGSNNGIPVSVGFTTSVVYPYCYVESGQVTGNFASWGANPSQPVGVSEARFRGAPSNHATNAETVNLVKVRSGNRGLSQSQSSANTSHIVKFMHFLWPEVTAMVRVLPGQKLHGVGHTITSSLQKFISASRGVAEPSIITRVTNTYAIRQLSDLNQVVGFSRSLMRQNFMTTLGQLSFVIKAVSSHFALVSTQAVAAPPRMVGRLLTGSGHGQTAGFARAAMRSLASVAVLATQSVGLIKKVFVVRGLSGGQALFLLRANFVRRSVTQNGSISLQRALTATRNVTQAQTVLALKGVGHFIGSIVNNAANLHTISGGIVPLSVQQSMVSSLTTLSSHFRTLAVTIGQNLTVLKMMTKTFALTSPQSLKLVKQTQKTLALAQAQTLNLIRVAAHLWSAAAVQAQSLSVSKGVAKTIKAIGHGQASSMSRLLGRAFGAITAESVNAVKALSKIVGFTWSQLIGEFGVRSVYQQRFMGHIQQPQQAGLTRNKAHPVIPVIQTSIAKAWYAAIYPNLEVLAKIIGRATAIIINGITQ